MSARSSVEGAGPTPAVVAAAPTDPSRVAWGARGLLATFNLAGVLGLPDVHTARRIGRIAGEQDETVLLAAALAVQALRVGSVCLDLTTASDAVFDDSEQLLATGALPWPEVSSWLAACRRSPLVTVGADAAGDRPLRLVVPGHSPGRPPAPGDPEPTRLYLERYWQQEEQVRTEILRRRSGVQPLVGDDVLASGLARLFAPAATAAGARLGPEEIDRQRMAAAVAALRTVSVVAGGPGTGKTTTVAKLLALVRVARPDARIALAAPTGKAAARLQEAVRDARDRLPAEDRERLGDVPALTLHRLLGWLPGGRFRHHAGQHLPYDVIVVDEMSMVPLTMMARLLEAVRPETRLVLVGDPDQLSSVEAGAVLADIVTAAVPGDTDLADRLVAVEAVVDGTGTPVAVPDEEPLTSVVRLRHTWRFGAAIGRLAAAVRAGDDEQAVAVLREGDPDVVFVEGDLGPGSATGLAAIDHSAADLSALADQVRAAGRAVHAAATTGDAAAALAALDRHRLLCAHRQGPYGVSRWSREAERWLAEAVPGYGTTTQVAGGRRSEWYPGRPLLITTNDYELQLYNGDTGVVLSTPNGVRAAFARGGEPTVVAPVRLEAVQTMHALTVHRAQGSQFGVVSFVVPPADSPLLTRELLYTAVTRAEHRVYVYGTEDAVRRAVRRPANRASGLRDRLA